jgi:predicted adenylyl cyclase CyaB
VTVKEIELIFKVKEPRAVVLKKLRPFTYEGIKKTKDIYFYDPLRADLHPDSRGYVLAGFRLRDKNGKFFLTYKKDHFDAQKKWHFTEENEISVSDYDTARKIIDHLGLRPLVTLKIKKHTFTTLLYEIVFEEAEGLGNFMEVEVRNSKKIRSVKKALADVRVFVDSLGLTLEELNIGKPQMMIAKLLKNDRWRKQHRFKKWGVTIKR